MSLEHWGKGQREKGNELGAAIASALCRWFGDEPLPSFAPSVKTTLGTPETQREIKRFSTEARRALEEQGYVIYGLKGQSIRDLNLRAGRKFWLRRCRDYSLLEASASMKSEVAINLEEPFLPGSNNEALEQQEEIVARFSKELGEKIPGVKAVIGQAPDYLGLVFAHLDRTGDFSFGEEYRYGSARTKTPTSGSRVATVGGFGPDGGFLHVSDWPANLGSGSVYAAPLVVPT